MKLVCVHQEIPPPPPPGISMEEAEELRENVERLEGELVELRAELAAKEDANNQLSKHCMRGKEREGGTQRERERERVHKIKVHTQTFECVPM